MLQMIKKQLKAAWIWQLIRAEGRRQARLGLNDGRLPAKLWDLTTNELGHLQIGGADSVELAKKFGTPLYVVDQKKLLDNYHRFVAAFERWYPHIELDYSYKTNPLPGALQVLHKAGAGAEVISPYELWLALKLGVSPKRITFNGPAKTDEGLQAAVKNGIRLVNIDNVDEIEKLDKFAELAGERQQVGIRVTTSVGWSSQFGLSIASGRARAAFVQAKESQHLEVCGLHVHLGTGIKSPATYHRAISECLDFAASLHKELGIDFRFLDFGGGFGVATVRQFSDTDRRLIAYGHAPPAIDVTVTPEIETYGKLVGELVSNQWRQISTNMPTVILEPGRSITSNAQSLLLRVLTIKEVGAGRANVILDGGLNVAQPTSFESHEILPGSRMNDRPVTTYTLCGPLCHPADVLAWNKWMPELYPGDIVAIMDAGAYFIPNQMNFSNPKAAAVIVADGVARQIRRREAFENVVGLDEL